MIRPSLVLSGCSITSTVSSCIFLCCFFWMAEGKIATVLGQLMKHNITVKELKSLIAALKGQEGKFWVGYNALY